MGSSPPNCARTRMGTCKRMRWVRRASAGLLEGFFGSGASGTILSVTLIPQFQFSGRIEIVVIRSGDGADFGESLLAQQFSVFEDGFEGVAGWNGFTIDDFDGGELFAILNEIEAAALAGFGGIGFRIFVDVVPLSVAVNGGTFQRELQRVAIDLL